MQNNATAKKGKGGTKSMVTKTETRIPNPVLGDMLVETDYSRYKDFGGVKFPTAIVQKQGGYPLLDLAVTDVNANVPLDLSDTRGLEKITRTLEMKMSQTIRRYWGTK